MRGARFVGVASMLALVADSQPSWAHALDLGTARLTLRDDHVEILAEVDLFLLSDVSPTEIAISTEPALAAQATRLVGAIETGTKLTIDGATVALRVRAMPPPAELRAIAATLSADGKDHGRLVPIRIEALGAFHEPKAMSLAMPSALGPVLVTLVQPVTRYAAPGAPASFVVSTSSAATAPPPSSPTVARPEPSHESSYWMWGGVVAALVWGVAVFSGRRFVGKTRKVVT